jgi:outer membrane protein assembly factor BamB
VKVNAIDPWGTLQRTPRRNGYVPITIDIARYGVAWVYNSSSYELSDVVSDGGNVYFTEPHSGSVFAKRASDGLVVWQRVFAGTNVEVAQPTLKDGLVYVPTKTDDGSFINALSTSDGLQTYELRTDQLAFDVTAQHGHLYVASTSFDLIHAFDLSDGSFLWDTSGGTFAPNTLASDNDFLYAYHGGLIKVFNPADGSLVKTIGQNSDTNYVGYRDTPILGSPDHVLAYMGTTWGYERPLQDYSVANQAVRWISRRTYLNNPAVAKGVVYATSNSSKSLDALDEKTGQLLWSWTAPTPTPDGLPFEFLGNVVVTDNIVLVSSDTSVYAIDLRIHKTVWSAATPGTMSISPGRMLLVSSTIITAGNPSQPIPRIVAYRLN